MNRCKSPCQCNPRSGSALKRDSKQALTSQSNLPSWHTYQTDTDTFYDAQDTFCFPDGYPSPPNTSKCKESNSLTKILQQICDGDQFRLALRNIVDNAENLLAAIEGMCKQSSVKCRNSFTNIIGTRLTRSGPPDPTSGNGSYAKSVCSELSRIDNRERVNLNDTMHITVEPITVNVPLTLYLRPNLVHDTFSTSIPMDDEESLGVPLETGRQIRPMQELECLCSEDGVCRKKLLYIENRYVGGQVTGKESPPKTISQSLPPTSDYTKGKIYEREAPHRPLATQSVPATTDRSQGKVVEKEPLPPAPQILPPTMELPKGHFGNIDYPPRPMPLSLPSSSDRQSRQVAERDLSDRPSPGASDRQKGQVSQQELPVRPQPATMDRQKGQVSQQELPVRPQPATMDRQKGQVSQQEVPVRPQPATMDRQKGQVAQEESPVRPQPATTDRQKGQVAQQELPVRPQPATMDRQKGQVAQQELSVSLQPATMDRQKGQVAQQELSVRPQPATTDRQRGQYVEKDLQTRPVPATTDRQKGQVAERERPSKTLPERLSTSTDRQKTQVAEKELPSRALPQNLPATTDRQRGQAAVRESVLKPIPEVQSEPPAPRRKESTLRRLSERILGRGSTKPKPVPTPIPEQEYSTVPIPLADHKRLVDISETKYGLGPSQRLALPQQKDLDLCVSCVCNECPVYDASEAVVCPGDCGCCSCPWRREKDRERKSHEEGLCMCMPHLLPRGSFRHCDCDSNYNMCPCGNVAENQQPAATENDRYGDHTNLSNQPNTTTYAGLGQQPTGPSLDLLCKAKDSEGDDEFFTTTDDYWNDSSSTEQYLTPRCSYPCPCQHTDTSCTSSSTTIHCPDPRIKISFHTPEGSFECLCNRTQEEQAACITDCVEQRLQTHPSILKISFLEKNGSSNDLKKDDGGDQHKTVATLLQCYGDNSLPCGTANCLVCTQGEKQSLPQANKQEPGIPSCDCKQSLCPCGDSKCNLSQEAENLPTPTDSFHSDPEDKTTRGEEEQSMNRKQSRSSRSERVKFPSEETEKSERSSQRKRYNSSTATLSSLLTTTENSSNTSYEDTDESYLDHRCSKPLYSTPELCPWSEDTLQACCHWILQEASMVHPGVPSSSGRTHTISRTSSTTIRNELCTCMQQQPEMLPSSSTPLETAKCERRQISTQSSTAVGQSFSFPTLPYTSLSARIPASEKVLPLLENIYEVLQGIRQDQLSLRSSVAPPSSGSLEPSKQGELEETCFDLPPPPPPTQSLQSPSVGQHIHIASTPPLNIFISPMSAQQAKSAPLCEGGQQAVAKKPSPTSEWVETSRYVHEIHGLEVMEPPVRDIDVQADPTTEVKTRRLIPVDMDLLRIDDDFDWKPHKAASEVKLFNEQECFIPEPSCSSRPGGISREIQVNGEELSCAGKKTDAKSVSFQHEPCVSKEVQVSEHALKEISPLGAQFLQFATDQCTQVKEACKTRVLTATLLDKPRYSSDSVSNESITCIETYTQEFGPEKPEKSPEISRPEHYQPKKISSDREEVPQSQLNSTECTCTDPIVCGKTCPGRMEKTPSAQILSFDDQLEGSCSEDTDTLSPEMSSEVISSRVLHVKVPALKNLATDRSVAKSDVGTDRPEFSDDDGRSGARSCCSNCGQVYPIQQLQNIQSDFVDSILCDLEVMKQCRENPRRKLLRLPPKIESFTKMKSQSSQPDLSFPVSIEAVQELGTNSLFIKWKVHNISNIAGYEIYLDGILTNRYFSVIHRAAVICQVDLNYPHRIILRAQSLVRPKTPRSARAEQALSARNPAGCCPQPDGSVWYPSVYHYEPKIYTAPTIIEYEESCANKC